MVLTIVGIQRVDMKTNDGDVHGSKVYGVVEDNQVKGFVGNPTATVWFDDANTKAQIPQGVVVGSVLEIFFEQQKKTPAFCREYVD